MRISRFVLKTGQFKCKDKGICLYRDSRGYPHPTPVLLPGKSHGRRSLVGCSPWGRGQSDTTERLDFHYSLSCIGEGNGNPLQRFCLENPRDGEAWLAAVYGLAQSRTWLKRLSSSSSSRGYPIFNSSPLLFFKWTQHHSMCLVYILKGILLFLSINWTTIYWTVI